MVHCRSHHHLVEDVQPPKDGGDTVVRLACLADRIDELLSMALERAALCSNDPFCASHDPNSELEKRYAHGAACHGCLLIAETSCERRNEFLDRALVVPTLIQQKAAFFTDAP